MARLIGPMRRYLILAGLVASIVTMLSGFEETRIAWRCAAEPEDVQVEQPKNGFKPASDPALDAEELRLMDGAEAALANGDTERAFSLLYEHATKFPQGQLARLRQALHIQTLCRVGKTADARAETASFMAQDPASPLAERVRGACGAGR